MKYFNKIHTAKLFHYLYLKSNISGEGTYSLWEELNQRDALWLNKDWTIYVSLSSSSFRKEDVPFPEILFLDVLFLQAFLLMICTYGLTKAFILILGHFFKIWSFHFSVRCLFEISFVNVSHNFWMKALTFSFFSITSLTSLPQ